MHRLLLIGALLSAGSVAAQEPARLRVTSAGFIAGQVVDATSGNAVAGAMVTVKGAGRIDVTIDSSGSVRVATDRQVVVDSQGRFAFAGLGPASYTLSATTPTGYAEGFASVELGRDERVTDVPVRMRRYASIAGTVRDDAGDPVVGAPVSAFLKIGFLTNPVLMAKGDAIADDRGGFRIGNLPPGEYLICARGRDPLTLDNRLLPLLAPKPPTLSAVVQMIDNSAPHYAQAFHPDSAISSGAAPIRLGAADDRVGMDITVRAVKPVRVSGQVQGLVVNPVKEMTFLLIPENDLPALGATTLSPTSITPDGAFEFATVPPGQFSLEVFPKDPSKGPWASMPITVGSENIDDLNVTLGSGATVTGRIEFSGGAVRPTGAALEMGRVSLTATNATPRLMFSSGTAMLIGHSADVTGDGNFRIENLPRGRYMVTVSGLGSWTIDTVSGDDDAKPDTLLTVSGSDLSGVVITTTDAAPATIEATVTLEKYEASQQFKVLIFPAEPSMWVESFRHPRRFLLAASATTKFRFQNLPAGDYFVTMEAAEMNLSPEALELWSRRATRVSVRPGELKAVVVRR